MVQNKVMGVQGSFQAHQITFLVVTLGFMPSSSQIEHFDISKARDSEKSKQIKIEQDVKTEWLKALQHHRTEPGSLIHR